jgi:HEAT repeat protein
VVVLKEILRGEKRPPIQIDKKRVVNALASSERSAEASAILAGVLADLTETTRVRATAAAQLSVMPREFAEKALVDNLETANEIVRREVHKSLTKIGSAKGGDMPEVIRQKRHALPIVNRSLAR